MHFIDKIQNPEQLKGLSISSLEFLCDEIREFLIDSVSATGGHLASNLGVVELTAALHYCFHSPADKIVWDVGHQAYVHKILTGRKHMFSTLRKLDGLSGFPKTGESPHDHFDTGHSSTSISLALGLAQSRDLLKEDYNVIAVIGDGAMTGGLAFEAMNSAGRLDSKLIIVLNDNQMSISENVGALSRYLNKIRTAPSYIAAKDDVHKLLRHVPVLGEKVDKFLSVTKDAIKNLLVPGELFEELGFTYFGPIDGHNLAELIQVLDKVKNINKPILLHVLTKKGKGYHFAEQRPMSFHGIEAFNVETGVVDGASKKTKYSDIVGQELLAVMEENEKVVAVTAAMCNGTGLSALEEKFPHRLFDVGIAEGHAVTFSAGLAKNGFTPVFVVYSSFLQRGYDQLLHDICIQNAHIVLCIDRAGIVGSDGETHQGLFDLSFLSHMPNMTVMAPKNAIELKAMLRFAINASGPVAVRYPRGSASDVLSETQAELKLGESETVIHGGDPLIISVGNMMDTAYSVCEKLKAGGIKPTLVNARFVKPVDTRLVESFKNYSHIFVLEDNVKTGGFAGLLLSRAAEQGIALPSFHSFAFPDKFIEQGSPGELYKRYELDDESIYSKIKATLNEQA